MKNRLFTIFALCLMSAAFSVMAQQSTNMYLIEVNGNVPVNLQAMAAEAGGEIFRVHDEIGLAVAQSDDPSFAAAMEGFQGIKSCTQDMMVQWVPSPDEMNFQALEIPEIQGHNGDPTLASRYACQWNLHQINAAGAWSQGEFGNPNVKVAVLDTGVDTFHIDMRPTAADPLGRIDAANSATFVSSSPCGALDTASFLDRNFHGSFVSGIITSNGLAVAGVAPDARVVGVKVLNCLGRGSFADIIAGILYASSLPDVQVINMSLGARFPKNAPGLGLLVAALNKAVNFAASQGVLVVSAAGNDFADLDHDRNFIDVPAQSGSGIAAWAGDIDGNLAGYSNHGLSGALVGAGGGDNTPGSPLVPLPGCTLPAGSQDGIVSICSSFSLFFGCGTGNFVLFGGTGTSFSAPAVSGVAALVDGKHGGSDSPGLLKNILKNTADDLGKPGADNLFSHGRVNANEAVKN